MKRLLPNSLRGRLIALLLLALAGAQVISFMIFAGERERALESLVLHNIGNRTAGAVRTLEATPQAMHTRILRNQSSHFLRFKLHDSNPLAGRTDTGKTGRLAQALRSELGGQVRDVQISFGAKRGIDNHKRQRPYIAVALQLPDGRWLSAVKPLRDKPPYWARGSLISLALTALLVVLAVIWMSRRITRPLAALSGAAERLGRGENLTDLPETGPEDIRRTTRAFNQMRARLDRFVGDRTRMLAAISHDLRTPITALRLRAEYIEDADNRERVLALLDEMEAMTEATLAFVREESATQERRRVDLTALVDATCEEYRELGQDVRFEPGPRLAYTASPLALTRALRNLIENAVAYAGAAEAEVRRGDDGGPVIAVLDRGPGIPAADRERVFDPFVRLETSRSRETGGIGLGLAIARSIARAHGGDIELTDRDGGGLEARLWLPAEVSA